VQTIPSTYWQSSIVPPGRIFTYQMELEKKITEAKEEKKKKKQKSGRDEEIL
jgi:hypothetical protein